MNLSLLKRFLPLVIIAIVIVLFVALDLGRFISFESLREHRETLNGWVSAYPLLAPLAYILLYIVVVAFSLPGGAVMTISGGFLFGALLGGTYAVLGATMGATALFLIAKTSLGDFLMAKAGPGIHKLQAGFSDNAMSYMFVLRLVPIFPFFLVNLAPAFLGVSLRIYLIATFFGIMPATFVYALAGSGLGSVFDQGGEFSIASILTPEMMAALLGLALLSLIPVAYKKIRKSRTATEEKSL
ncbi:MAG: TVP38/TMEM64 family protein [Mariprofundaceae bacterium]